jgi:DNA polymerase III delta subunit
MVVIYYDQPQTSVLETLRNWAALFPGDKDGVIVVPYPGLGSAIVLTAWTKRLRLATFEPAAAAAFIDAFRGRGADNRVP